MKLDPDALDQASLDELLELAREKYDVAFEPVSVGDTTIEVLQIANMDEYVEQLAETAAPTRGIELPFWAKIWPASILLAHFMRSPDPAGKKALEIGAGVGVTGLFAAAFGFETVISDVNDDALLFARAAALKNGLADRVRIVRADFTDTDLGERFDYVLGAEILYRPDTYRGLVKFLLGSLKREPGAEAVLAKAYSRKSEKFFKLAADEFEMTEKSVGIKSGDQARQERHLITIHRLRPRKHA
jgi:predicted nicotinamide N-methyase